MTDMRSRSNSYGKNLALLKGINQKPAPHGSCTPEIAEAQNLWLFEVAWEVANKVGGIYTVIKTKAAETVREYGDQYILFGPYKENTAKLEVEQVPSSHYALKSTIEQMSQHNIKVIHGRWLIDGYPKVILFDLSSASHKLQEWRADLFEKAKIGIPWEDTESNDCLLFGFLVCWFISEFRTRVQSAFRPQIITHFHEWMSGVGLIMLGLTKVDVATIFTTHATLLGRFLCAGDVDFYNNLEKFEKDKEAGDRGIYHRYCVERAAVHVADVFTTVSDITGYECKYLVEREPDVITPNGLNVTKYTAMHEFQNLHAQSKAKIHHFVQGHFHGHLDFDLDRALYFFSAGRYEFKNKGVDMFIESLARLNYRLQQHNPAVTVVVFLIFPTKTHNFNVESLKGQAISKSMHDTVELVQKHVGVKLLDKIVKGEIPANSDDLLSKDDIIKLKTCAFSAQRSSLPPICTHNVVDDHKDQILNALRQVLLFNDRHDRVKVVYHPEFLSSTNPLLGMDYEEFVRGCHLGVFASYYEPWGYTPAECTLLGVPSISTDLAGFGSFVDRNISHAAEYGIHVVSRRNRSPEDAMESLTKIMFDFTTLTRKQRILLRNRTERLSDLFDWRNLISYYREARVLSLCKLLNVTQLSWMEQPSFYNEGPPSPGRSVLYGRPGSCYTTPASSRPSSPPPLGEGDEHDSDGERSEIGFQ